MASGSPPRHEDSAFGSDTPIAVIAREVGWSDPDFAARQFRRSVGIAPSRYREMSRARSGRATG